MKIFVGCVRGRQGSGDHQPRARGCARADGAATAGREQEDEVERHQRPLPVLRHVPKPDQLDGRPPQADGHVGEAARRQRRRAFDEQPPRTQGGDRCQVLK